MDRIPTSLIGLLSQIFPDRYTQAEIDSLFLFAGAPEPIPDGSKATKVQAWLRQINARADQPTRVLGIILDDFISWNFNGETIETFEYVCEIAFLS